MADEVILIGTLLEESWLTLEQIAAACAVEPQWLAERLEAGLIAHAECAAAGV